nr:MAG TPA: hypothetical protein [Caudoviricetes sp.]DAR71151.1 MAG TPA: hypothetical protein [Caudoviricetes sp.]
MRDYKAITKTGAVYRRPLTLYLWTIWIKFLVGNNGV